MQTLTAADFVASTAIPELEPDSIHVWFCAAAGAMPGTGAERRGQRVLRQLLGAYLGRDGSTLELGSGAFGKPYLADPAGIEFNLSHSGDALLLAFARDQALGVDLERPGKPRPVLALAQRYFCPSESAALGALADAAPAFLDLWTCKEAVLKALGRGLAFGLDRLEFAVADGSAQHLAAIAAEAGVAGDWQLRRLRPDATHVGALAWHGAPRRIRAFRYGRAR